MDRGEDFGRDDGDVLPFIEDADTSSSEQEREFSAEEVFRAFDASLPKPSKKELYFTERDAIFEKLSKALADIGERAENHEEDVLRYFLEHYIGDEHEEKWGSLSSDNAEYEAYRGDDNLLVAFFQDKHIQKMLERVSPDVVNTIFQTLISGYREKLRIKMQQENGDVDSSSGDWGDNKGDFDNWDWDESSQNAREGRSKSHLFEEGKRLSTYDMEEMFFIDQSIGNSYNDAPSDLIPTMNHVIRDFAKFGNRETIDTLIDIIDHDFFASYGAGSIMKALEAIDSSYAAQKLMEKIQRPDEERQDSFYYPHDIDFYSNFLRSIEFGKIGIDEGVVTYLERKYFLKGEKKTKQILLGVLLEQGR